ncbi:MAG: polysaccharide deacetylase family protein [Saprospiraceae bacterium]|nr:polysaccharide deacetylase family protein [Saprospiraceae bacterium]
MKLIFSIDWEDFGQLCHKNHFAHILPPKTQIERQTNLIIDLLDNYNVKGTFFVLGILAEYRPDLVKLIQTRGHEIALHGMYHDSLMSLNIDQIYNDICLSKDKVSQIIGQDILGYRAPYFSLKSSKFQVLEVLSELNFTYDSSIYPTSFARYGIPNFNREYTNVSLPNGKSIVELPATVLSIMNKNFPISGGGYFRILNKQLLKVLFNKAVKDTNEGMIYLHPYEFDNVPISIEQYRDEGFKLNVLEKMKFDFKSNLSRKSIVSKLIYFLEKYQFETALDASLRVRKHQDNSINILFS